MTRNKKYTIKHRLYAWAMALFMLCQFIPFAALATPMPGLPTLTLTWQVDGTPDGRTLQPMDAFGNTFWAQLPAEAPMDQITFQIVDPTYPSDTYFPQNGSVLQGIQNAGGSFNQNQNYVTIYPVDAQGAQIPGAPVYFLYISTEPAPVEQVMAQAQVEYRLEDGSLIPNIENPVFVTVTSDNPYVTPALNDPAYTLISEGQKHVTINPNGTVTEPVVFTYQAALAPEPEEKQVTVSYINQNDGSVINSFAELIPLEGKTISAPSLEGYTLTSQETDVFVNYDENGNLFPSEVVFTYSPAVFEEKEVAVRYINDADGSNINAFTELVPQGGKTISAPSLEGYTLASQETEVFVNYDENGNLFPSEVVFHYTPAQVGPFTGTITITYVENGNEANILGSETVQVDSDSDNRFISAPATINEGTYEFVGANSPTEIIFDNQGNYAPQALVFAYQALETEPPQAEVDVIYIDENQNPIYNLKQTVTGPEATIEAPQTYAFEGKDYVLAPDENPLRTIAVQEPGSANPNAVTFRYQLVVTETQPPAPVAYPITVEYYVEGETGQGAFFSYNEEVTFTDGRGIVYALDDSQVQFPDDRVYTFIGERLAEIYVDENGNLNPSTVTFMYSAAAKEKPVLTIHYVYEENQNTFDTESRTMEALGSQAVSADLTRTPQGYELVNGDSQTVEVSESAVVPDTITFYFKKSGPSPDEVTATVQVSYVNVLGETLAPDQSQTLTGVGEHTLTPSPQGLSQNYQVVEGKDTSFTITLSQGSDGTGVAKPDKVTFVLEYSHGEELPPIDSTVYRWSVANAPGLKVRSSTDDSSKTNILATIKKGTHVWVDYVAADERDGTTKWARVKVVTDSQGTTVSGYILAKFLNVMTPEDSNAYQQTIDYTMPTDPPPPKETEPPAVETDPPAVETDPPPVETEPPYLGWAKTNRKTSVRTDKGTSDVLFLDSVEVNTLVEITRQDYDEPTQQWYAHSVVYGHNNNLRGYIATNDLTYITDNNEVEKLKDQVDKANATPTPAPSLAPSPTPVAPQEKGFAKTKGDDVPLRTMAHENAGIYEWLAANEVVYVNGQVYPANSTSGWHQVYYNSRSGYIRTDQLQFLSIQETQDYLNSSATPPTQPPAITPIPVDPNSPSSYGYVEAKNGVNFRQGPGKNYKSLGTLKQYGLGLILDQQVAGSEIWYKIRINGIEGYVSGGYFKAMTLAEANNFIGSQQYLQGMQNNASFGQSQSGSNNSNNSTNNNRPLSPEDSNLGTWVNPNAGATFAPFDPFATPSPLASVEPSLLPSVLPSVAPTMDPLATIPPLNLPTDNTEEGSFPTGLVVAGAVLLLGGGGLYGYSVYSASKKKAAAKAAQQKRNQQGPRGPQPPTGGGRPQPRSGVAPVPPVAGRTQDGKTPPSRGASVPRQTLPPQPGAKPGTPGTGVPGQQRPGTPIQRPGQPPQGTPGPNPNNPNNPMSNRPGGTPSGTPGSPAPGSGSSQSPYAPPRTSTPGQGAPPVAPTRPAGATQPKEPGAPAPMPPAPGQPSLTGGANAAPASNLSGSTKPLNPIQANVPNVSNALNQSTPVSGTISPGAGATPGRQAETTGQNKPISTTQAMPPVVLGTDSQKPPMSPGAGAMAKEPSAKEPSKAATLEDGKPAAKPFSPEAGIEKEKGETPRRQPRSLRHQQPTEDDE